MNMNCSAMIISWWSRTAQVISHDGVLNGVVWLNAYRLPYANFRYLALFLVQTLNYMLLKSTCASVLQCPYNYKVFVTIRLRGEIYSVFFHQCVLIQTFYMYATDWTSYSIVNSVKCNRVLKSKIRVVHSLYIMLSTVSEFMMTS